MASWWNWLFKLCFASSWRAQKETTLTSQLIIWCCLCGSGCLSPSSICSSFCVRGNTETTTLFSPTGGVTTVIIRIKQQLPDAVNELTQEKRNYNLSHGQFESWTIWSVRFVTLTRYTKRSHPDFHVITSSAGPRQNEVKGQAHSWGNRRIWRAYIQKS